MNTTNTHIVYDNIASEFNKTRYSVWQHVRMFLDSIPKHSVGADIGCGNGKNINYRNDLVLIGNDLSQQQVFIASQNCDKADMFVANALNLPYRTKTLDFAISIAVIHHLHSASQRYDCIHEIIRCVKPGGRILITLWAREQMIKDSWKLVGENDYLIPWNMHDGTIHERFYHLTSRKEVEEIHNHFSKIVNTIYYWTHMDNWYIEISV
jgi:tRNA (uracil-5-)-methyltransferase TRM9